jgi:enamine deaminase RidA (YjgF/YER057c/UK114 family)
VALPDERKFRRLGDFSIGKWVGDTLHLSGLVGLDPRTGKVVRGYDDLPGDVAERLRSGQVSVDNMEGPIVAQAWTAFELLRGIVEGEGLSLRHVVHITHFMTDLTDFPAYNRVRGLVFDEDPPTSTVVEVTRLLPCSDSRLEIEARVARELPVSLGHVSDMS